MEEITQETIRLLNELPLTDQLMINEIVKKLVKALNKDYTKLIEDEENKIEKILIENQEDFWK